MEKTKEKTPATAFEMKEVLIQLLREDIVGLVCERDGTDFDFVIPCEKRFRITVEEAR